MRGGEIELHTPLSPQFSVSLLHYTLAWWYHLLEKRCKEDFIAGRKFVFIEDGQLVTYSLKQVKVGKVGKVCFMLTTQHAAV